jgi:hypothetical protein
MNELLRAASAGSLGSRMQQDDKDLIADVDKLVSITNMLVDTYRDFIVEVHVAPMNIIQMKTSELKHLSFHIVYNGSYACNLLDMQNDLRDMLSVLVDDEFDGISKIDDISFHMYANWTEPTIMLYTVFDGFTIEDLSDEDYVFLYGMLEKNECAITIPKTYKFAKVKCIFVHSPSTVMVSRVDRGVVDYCVANGKVAGKVSDNDNSLNLVYEMMVGLQPIRYNIPYIYVDRNSFNVERLEELGIQVG